MEFPFEAMNEKIKRNKIRKMRLPTEKPLLFCWFDNFVETHTFYCFAK